jgi:hypothetical protein
MGLLYIEGLLAAAVVCYVHRAIPRFTATAARRTAAHGVLLLTGCAFGIVTALHPGSPCRGGLRSLWASVRSMCRPRRYCSSNICVDLDGHKRRGLLGSPGHPLSR